MILLVGLLVASYLVAPALAQTVQTGTVTRNANLRVGPGTTYAVRIVATNAASDWYELEGGQWIAAFLARLDTAPAPAGFIFDDVEVWTVGEVAPAEQAPAVTPTPPVATATPAPSPTATPKPAKPTATPTPTLRAYTLDDFEVEWGPLGHLFAVSNARIGQQWMTTQLGQSVESTVLAFDVEAKRQITFGVFMAHFYNAEGKEVGLFSPVIFDPLPDLGWETGMDGTAAVILPIDDLEEIRATSR